MDTTRPPPSAAPPPYVRAVGRVYRRSLRPVIFFTCAISLVWAVVLGIRFIRNLSEQGETSKMKTFDIVLAVLFFVVAGIEVFGLMAAYTQRIMMARMYFLLSTIAAFVTFGTETLRLVAHFILKTDTINVCANSITGDAAYTSDGTPTTLSTQDAQDICSDSWSRDTWFDIAWLIVSTILAFVFASLAAAYYHQLLNPSYSRTTEAPSNAFRMGPWSQPPAQQYSQDLPFVPPYPGGPTLAYAYGGGPSEQPPEYAGGYAPPEKEKGDLGLNKGDLEDHNDSTATLQPVSLHDPPSSPTRPGEVEGRV